MGRKVYFSSSQTEVYEEFFPRDLILYIKEHLPFGNWESYVTRKGRDDLEILDKRNEKMVYRIRRNSIMRSKNIKKIKEYYF